MEYMDRLNKLTKDLKPMIDQYLEGLLYDVDLCPEQINNKKDGIRYTVIVNQKEKIEELEKENKQLESEIKDYRERLGLRV